MRSLNVLLLSIVTLSASLSYADLIRECEASLQQAREESTRTTDRFNIGEVSLSEVASANLALLETRVRCGNMTEAEYCVEAPATAKTIVDGMSEEARLGMRTANDVRAAGEKLKSVEAKCK